MSNEVINPDGVVPTLTHTASEQQVQAGDTLQANQESTIMGGGVNIGVDNVGVVGVEDDYWTGARAAAVLMIKIREKT